MSGCEVPPTTVDIRAPPADPSFISTTGCQFNAIAFITVIGADKTDRHAVDIQYRTEDIPSLGVLAVELPTRNNPNNFIVTSQPPNTTLMQTNGGATIILIFTNERIRSVVSFFSIGLGTPEVSVPSMMISLSIDVPNNEIVLPPQPGPPLSNQNFCTDPVITISAQLSNTSGDVLEAVFDVMDAIFHREVSSNNCYQGCTSPIDNGTRIVVYSLFVNCTIRGPQGSSGNLLQKFGGDNSLMRDVIGYALTKLILGRLVTGEFNIRWIYQCHYNELRRLVFESRYRSFVTVLDKFFDLNQYYFCCDEPQG